jgi:tetratricopeptide (TPR) repeat protein
MQLSAEQRQFYDQAVESLGQNSSGQAFGELGKRLLADGFAVASEPCFRNAVQLEPERFDWNYYLAQVLLGSGRHQEAATGFKRAIELDPESVAAVVWLGNAYFRAAAYDAAAEAFDSALTLHPDAASAYLGLGRTRLAEQRYDDAVDALTRALELSPDASIAHYPLAQAYRALGESENARLHLEKRGEREAYPIDPLMEEIRTNFGSPGVFTDRGGSAYSKGEFERSVAAFRRAVEMAPAEAMAHANLGSALMSSGDLDSARSSFERALELDDVDVSVLYSLGAVATVDGQPDVAIEYYRRAISLDSKYVPAHLELAHQYAAQRRFEDAVKHYRAAVALEPRRAVAQWGLFVVFIREEDWALALEQLELSISALPDQPAFTHALARLLASAPDSSLRDGRRALQIVDDLIRSGMSSTDLGETLAMALAEEGDFAQAARIQKQALQAVQQAGEVNLIKSMKSRLERYELGRSWNQPWASDDVIFESLSEALPSPPRRGSFDS